MTNSLLDSRTEIAKIDVHQTLLSIEQLGNQVQHIWELAEQVEIDDSYAQVSNVVVCGMGGSVLGTHVIQTVFKDELKVPVTIVPDYTLPAFVDEKTLVVASSYSGSTEETVAAMEEALKRNSKVVGITSGGIIEKRLKEEGRPVLVFEPTYNPSGQPRMGLGYSIFGQMLLLSRAGILNVTKEDYDNVLEVIAKEHLRSGVDISSDENHAKLLAFSCAERIPVITVSEHLEGVGHVFANQLNENAKTYSEFRVIPELNHHLIEGLKNPHNLDGMIYYFTVHSDLYMSQNSLRMNLTQEILEEHSIDYLSHKLTSDTKLGQAFELLTLGAYASFYTAMLHNIDPAPIPHVDWLKKQLAERG